MVKKRFNAKARQGADSINSSKPKKDSIYIDNPDDEYDPNKAAEPEQSLKKNVNRVSKEKKNIRILSKKQRKRLQQIVDKQNKKKNSADVIMQLADYKLPDNELCRLVSITELQTVGRRKMKAFFKEAEENEEERMDVSDVKLTKRKRRQRKRPAEENTVPNNSADNSGDESSDDSLIGMPTENKKPKSVIVENKTFVDPLPIKVDLKKSFKKEPNNEIPQSKPVKLRKVIHVPVHRTAKIQASRLKLPIVSEEHLVMEAINENPIVIVAGETGSGKTTQIPQFLYEAGYALDKQIAITEPRRLAAIAMSKRVAHEMNLAESEVSYLVRFDNNVTEDTRILFMTDGVLLEMMKKDSLLIDYSVVIIDEAHERSMHTDILIGILSRIVLLREKRGIPLKLIIMSATLHVKDFIENSRLFRTPPPLLKIGGRQFPVTERFSKKTPKDYVAAAFSKAASIHATEPQGGMLIFLTGKEEIERLVRKLRNAFPCEKKLPIKSTKQTFNDGDANSAVNPEVEENTAIDSDDDFDTRHLKGNRKKMCKRLTASISLPKIDLSVYKLPAYQTEEDFMEDLSDDESNLDDINVEEDNIPVTKQPLWVLPLYSQLPKEKQERVFEPPPEGCRLCVVATNIAETSITIPNIKYVVDSGMQKRRIYDNLTGVSTYTVTYTSKASAKQRAGRAGRVSAGHCYRLYSSACFGNEFPDFFEPDIRQKPADELVLYMKCLNIVHVDKFPFPTPPERAQLEMAERRLAILGALEERATVTSPAVQKRVMAISELGRRISAYPVAPRYGKMLVLSNQQELLPYTVCLVAALSIQELFIDQAAKKVFQKKYASDYINFKNCLLLGDAMVLLSAVCAAEYAQKKNNEGLDHFCGKYKMRRKALDEISNLRRQLTERINSNVENANIYVDPGMLPPTNDQANLLRQILLAGMGDRVAHKICLNEISDKKEKRRLEKAYNCLDMDEPVFMNSSSVLNRNELSEWIIYQELYEQQQGDSTKIYIRGITAIEPQWLLSLVPQLCNIRKICEEELSTRYDDDTGELYCYVEATYGKAAWNLPPAEIEMHKIRNFSNSEIEMSSKMIYNYFAMYFLDGSVCRKLQKYSSQCAITPSSILKSFTDMNKYCVQFKNALKEKKVFSRKSLLDAWSMNPNYLLNEYQALLVDVSMDELKEFWPPINKIEL